MSRPHADVAQVSVDVVERAPNIGVIIPCRNEAAVIERKIANLARARWPASASPHLIVVVDDGSDDRTIEHARSAANRWFVSRERASDDGAVEILFVRNALRPGKPGAIGTGLAELEGCVDLVAITDADVVIDERAIEAIVREFARERDLAMVCLSQRFVADLADDGTCRGKPDGDGVTREIVSAASRFDRWTARVRALESRSGRLFSVHGQFLAWRASLRLVPSLGIAADDLDLMMQVRSRTESPRGVRMLGEVAFYEVKTRALWRAREQATRRARAYVQVIQSGAFKSEGLVDAMQFCFYRRLPLWAPALTALVPLALLVAAYAIGGTTGLVVALALGALAASTNPVRRWVALMRVIHGAMKLERAGTLAERWEMARR